MFDRSPRELFLNTLSVLPLRSRERVETCLPTVVASINVGSNDVYTHAQVSAHLKGKAIGKYLGLES
jgi:hypothetical protein